MNAYEEKQAARKLRLLDAADRHEEKASTAYARSDLSESASGIPLGQPILVGHHSEGRHRRAIARAHAAMDKSVEHGKTADKLRSKAAGVGTGGISSDDPDALEKLREKLANLETAQANMKAANRIVRKWSKKGVTHETEGTQFDSYAAELAAVADHFSAALARKILEPYCGRVVAFESYQLTNNNAKIKSAKDRIAQLEKLAEATTKRQVIQGVCDLVENAEENRVQFIFDGKPSAEVRKVLKSHGFRWAPSQEAWQRQLTNNARYSAKMVLRALGVEAGASPLHRDLSGTPTLMSPCIAAIAGGRISKRMPMQNGTRSFKCGSFQRSMTPGPVKTVNMK